MIEIKRLKDTIERFKKENYFEIKTCFIRPNIYIKLRNFMAYNYNDYYAQHFFYNGIRIQRVDNYYLNMPETHVLMDSDSSLRKIVDFLTDDEYNIKNIIE